MSARSDFQKSAAAPPYSTMSSSIATYSTIPLHCHAVDGIAGIFSGSPSIRRSASLAWIVSKLNAPIGRTFEKLAEKQDPKSSAAAHATDGTF